MAAPAPSPTAEPETPLEEARRIAAENRAARQAEQKAAAEKRAAQQAAQKAEIPAIPAPVITSIKPGSGSVEIGVQQPELPAGVQLISYKADCTPTRPSPSATSFSSECSLFLPSIPAGSAFLRRRIRGSSRQHAPQLAQQQHTQQAQGARRRVAACPTRRFALLSCFPHIRPPPAAPAQV